MKKLDVTCALVCLNGKTLVVQRSEKMKLPLKWEFPGGKIENGESAEDCVKREIWEELNIEIELISKLSHSNFDYPNFSIELIPFIARYVDGDIKLSEHKQYLLLEKVELNDLDWAEADIPILNEFLRL
ncbi:(deoxy)nucleoside triphosphate pyrophosphohydrolase [Psychroflexus planctonicus]|uniref:8-oxo-dGTP diphosphatase n=1 Tax=Psychroflexus planctonicus TaxID=1526575 RepID=A0ABQ1SF25_9FLAO|nr:(deoxy)nucleoside triphosphate pyrophosphohydrolase [Psychroflexus planctonicus]GGE25471.1 NUDIX hydrolase [Psychroflexus planctonicus]